MQLYNNFLKGFSIVIIIISHLFLQQLTVDKARLGVCEAASRAGVDVAGGKDGHHVFILSGLSGNILEQSWKKVKMRSECVYIHCMLCYIH